MALAVISLKQTLEQLLHPQHNDLRIGEFVKTLQNKLCSLRDLLQNSFADGNGETMITNVACKAEDVISSNLLDVRNQVEGAAEKFPDELKKLIEEIQSVVKEVKKFKKKGKPKVGVERGTTVSPYRDSYDQLPLHLKGCLVYTAVFPEGAEIPVSKLIKLWMAEGLLQKVRGRSFEEVAEACLEELTDRNLVLIRKYGSNGKAKTCMVHNLLRELCLREAKTQKFLLVISNCGSSLPADMKCHSRFGFHSMKWKDMEKILDDGTPNTSRSILNLGMSWCHYSMHLHYGRFKLLRVLDLCSVTVGCLYDFPTLKALIYLKYLAFCINDLGYSRPTHHFLSGGFQCLQTFIFRNILSPTPLYLFGPDYKMAQLRHLDFEYGDIYGLDTNEVLFPNLQTLSGIRSSSCGPELLRHIPDLKKLGIKYYEDNRGQPNCLGSVHLLHSLVALKLKCIGGDLSQKLYLPDVFPLNLKKLTLLKSCLPWKDMTILIKLPNLEILKLKDYAFTGPEWQATEESFLKLKVLVLESLDLISWKASSDYFSTLQRLIVRRCYHLEGIPREIGDILTLQEIELDHSNHSVMDSAQEILEEQRNFGNNDFHVHFNSSRRDDNFNSESWW